MQIKFHCTLASHNHTTMLIHYSFKIVIFCSYKFAVYPLSKPEWRLKSVFQRNSYSVCVMYSILKFSMFCYTISTDSKNDHEECLQIFHFTISL